VSNALMGGIDQHAPAAALLYEDTRSTCDAWRASAQPAQIMSTHAVATGNFTAVS
jgi:hypothetical protein